MKIKIEVDQQCLRLTSFRRKREVSITVKSEALEIISHVNKIKIEVDINYSIMVVIMQFIGV